VLASVAAVALAAGLIAFVATRTERGAGEPVTPRPAGLATVRLSSGAAHDYDPDPLGDDKEHPEETRNAIDGNRTTEWSTESYRGAFGTGGGKAGVGLYVDAGRGVAARRLVLVTSTPGFEAEVYAANEVPDEIGGWTRVSGRARVDENERIPLDVARRRFRYYLVWIVSLPEDENRAVIRELRLFR
jgi:hypothetical protein